MTRIWYQSAAEMGQSGQYAEQLQAHFRRVVNSSGTTGQLGDVQLFQPPLEGVADHTGVSQPFA
jgi:hypothetical protein